MKLIKRMTLFTLVLNASVSFAAEPSVPADSSIHVKADPALKTLIPADILKRGYIVEQRTRIRRQLPFIKKIIRRWPVAKSHHECGG